MSSEHETKYGHLIDDNHNWEDEEDAEPDEDAVFVGTHFLEILDERESIEQYNGLAWMFHFDEESRLISGVGKSHYCPGPSHTDPMGFVAWDDLPELVREAALDELNAEEASEIVDVEATAEAAEVRRP